MDIECAWVTASSACEKKTATDQLIIEGKKIYTTKSFVPTSTFDRALSDVVKNKKSSIYKQIKQIDKQKGTPQKIKGLSKKQREGIRGSVARAASGLSRSGGYDRMRGKMGGTSTGTAGKKGG